MRLAKFRSLIIAAALIIPCLALAQADLNAGIEAKVREAFADAPTMVSVAKCESGFRQFGASGPLHGGAGGKYVGIFQIDEQLHTAAATALGFDITTTEGNIAYARHLYSVSGTNPWKGCLSGTVAIAPVAAQPTGALSANMRLGVVDGQVLLLQRLLNRIGFVLAASGPGSPGNETMRFGPLTRDAVRRFQCAKAIVCEGDESTTGYGNVGPRTRAALQANGE
jgi:hypothetical protein